MARAGLLLFLASATWVLTTACDTGFGQSCTLPKSDEFREACSQSSRAGADAGSEEITQSSAASCAVDNFAGCETRVCLVYRDHSPFCSLQCGNDDDCPDSAICMPLVGSSPSDCGNPDKPLARCYCVKESMVGGGGDEPPMMTPDPSMLPDLGAVPGTGVVPDSGIAPIGG